MSSVDSTGPGVLAGPFALGSWPAISPVFPAILEINERVAGAVEKGYVNGSHDSLKNSAALKREDRGRL